MAQGRTIGRYVLYDEIGAGGMATVHIGRLLGTAGFTRTVAIKRLHPHCARDPQFVTLFLDEARLTGRIRHPNVAAMLDVVSTETELLLVMEYIHGETLSRLMTLTRDAGAHVAPRIAVAIIVDVLRGLHAAHDATTELGEPLGIIHRDVTPQNVLVGADGVTRLVDFGVAKAASRLQVTGEGQIKGKFPYMAPEQIQDHPIDRRVDVYAAAVVLWEVLTARRLFTATNTGAVVTRVLEMEVLPPSTEVKDIPKALDEVVMRGLSRDVNERFATAEAMAHALEQAMAPATAREVSEWVQSVASEQIVGRAQLVSSVERSPLPTGDAELSPSSAPPPDGSQISNISVSMTARRPKKRGRLAFILAAAGALLTLGVLLFAARSKPQGAAAAQAPPPPSSSTRQTPSSAPITIELPTISATGTFMKHTPRVQQSASGTPNCNPRYTVDPSDPRIHIAKPECF